MTATTERRWRGRPTSARNRILGWYVLLLGISLVAALLLQRAFLLAEITGDIDQAHDQEVAEVRQLAIGIDPSTGEPFGTDIASVFDQFMATNVPSADEAVVTLVEGRPYKADVQGAELAADENLVRLWAAHVSPARGEVATADGPLRYLVMPITSTDGVLGTFVVSTYQQRGLDAVNQVVRLGAAVYGSIFLVASALAWVAAGGVLRPLRDLSETAQSISETDLARRIPVEGDDEIASLGETFNAMLDRVEAAFATQRRFADDAGHELRTPITVIRGNLELMGDDPEDRAQTVALVMTELDRMTRIVDDLLVLAKVDQTDYITRHPFDLAAFMDDVLARARLLDDRPWELTETDDVVVDGDEQWLTQAMMNLARNAVEHTPAGTPVRMGADSDSTGVEFWVHDDGPGIPLEGREHLFDRFARGAEGKRSTKGAGLGLAIVRAIAEGHGGGVEVESEPGAGTTFRIRIPMEAT